MRGLWRWLYLPLSSILYPIWIRASPLS